MSLVVFDCFRVLDLRRPGCLASFFDRILARANNCRFHSGPASTSIRLLCNQLSQQECIKMNENRFEQLQAIIKAAFTDSKLLKDPKPASCLLVR